MSGYKTSRNSGKLSVVCFLIWLALSVNNILTSGDNQGIFLSKVPSHVLVQIETAPCVIETVSVLNRPECALWCNHHLPECATILYSDVNGLCKLLQCRPTDKLRNQVLVGIPFGWDIWEDTQACKKGWILFAGHCYSFHAERITWNNAVAKCNSLGAYLIEFQSQEEVTWVDDSFLLPEGNKCPWILDCFFWIGASRKWFQFPLSSAFTYNSGDSLIYPEWALLQPDNKAGNEFCVAITRTGKGHDISCTSKFQFICKMKK